MTSGQEMKRDYSYNPRARTGGRYFDELEDVPVSTILGTLSALEALCDYALYKSTFTLHLQGDCGRIGTILHRPDILPAPDRQHQTTEGNCVR